MSHSTCWDYSINAISSLWPSASLLEGLSYQKLLASRRCVLEMCNGIKVCSCPLLCLVARNGHPPMTEGVIVTGGMVAVQMGGGNCVNP